ncbi:MAG: hypothetical protein J1F31_04685 [Erysipelotrichales bacterium]|nr:hypothetical protein [Erysipelotrichales bacterium]
MKIIVNNVFLTLNEDETNFKNKLLKILKVKEEDLIEFKLIKKAVDARKKSNILFVCSFLVTLKKEYKFNNSNIKTIDFVENLEIPEIKMKHRPVIVGFGPAGMFLGLYLARANTKPIILERGKSVDERLNDINKFKETGVFNSGSNVCFGEGGAGTFSDGKLNTGIKDQRIRFCLNEFIKHGAPKEIYYEAHPHIGSDNLRKVVKNIREEIISLGGEVRFEHQFIDFKKDENIIVKIKNHENEYELITDDLVLAIGHSARDTYKMLYENGMFMKPKDFSMGVRIEHLQESVNFSQYGKEYKNPKLPVADYKIVLHLPNNRTLYSFCMCPGGEVVASNSEENSIVTNGMSYFKRDLDNANSALLVNVRVEDYYKNSPLDGVEFQKKYEQLAFNSQYPYFAPIQRVDDFLNNKISDTLRKVTPSYKPGFYFASLDNLLPDFVIESLKMGIPMLQKKFPFFQDEEAIMTGVETRSSSPVVIPRDDRGFSSIANIYPCGEGASYAGGIMSAAIDGLRVGDFIRQKYKK